MRPKNKEKVNKSGDTMTGDLSMVKNSGNTGYFAKRSDTGVEVLFGVDTGGENHGVYSKKINKWLVYADASNVYLNEYNMNRFLRSEANVGDFNSWDKQNSVKSYTEDNSNRPSNLAAWGTLLTLHDNDSDYTQQLAIGNYNNGGCRMAIRSKAEGQAATSWELLELKATTLYNNLSGTTGTVTLSSNASNFAYLEIFYGDSANGMPKDSLKVYSPNSAIVNSSILSQDDTEIRVNTRRLTILDTTITPSYYQVNYLPSGLKYATNEQKIYRVIGYK